MSIVFENVCFSYDGNTNVLKNINIEINDGEFIGIIGQSGCGKTTFVQHFNALLKPVSGRVLVDGVDTKDKKVRDLRRKVGMVFQYPEHQLFEMTVYKDIEYGLKKLNLSEQEKRERILKAIKDVGLEEEILERTPFELSGGQKRRVAIAGVLVMNPKVLILDEPSAGLDPEGKKKIYNLLTELWEKENISIILISHNMDDVAKYTKRVLVIDDGQIVLDKGSNEIFEEKEKIKELGLGIPEVTVFMEKLKEKIPEISDKVYTVKDAVKEIERHLEGGLNG